MTFRYFISLLVIMGSLLGMFIHAVADMESPAITEAKCWLNSIDSNEYMIAWKETDDLFKGFQSTIEWIDSIRECRQAFGPTVSRNVLSVVAKNALPGFPVGQYVVVQFDTSFKRKYAVIEYVSLKQYSKSWKVVKYYVK